MTLIIAVPSKGRLKEQVDSWLEDCGLGLRAVGGARGYSARLEGFEEVEVRLASAGDIAAALVAGDVHLGVTGEDLLREADEALDAKVMLLRALGFGRADLVVAVPQSWIDVDTMADVDDVAHLYLARTGRRLRVATKYLAQTRAFLARHGIADYRLVESGGATEGAPAAGAAEIIVDITTSGATLAANGLKVLGDGVILPSQAHLAASLLAPWDGRRLETCRRLLGIIEARARGAAIASLVWPSAQDATARAALSSCVTNSRILGDTGRANGILVAQAELFAATEALAVSGVGPVSVTRPAYVFKAISESAVRLAAALDIAKD
jgi:ATP phosphoribosyltransferase